MKIMRWAAMAMLAGIAVAQHIEVSPAKGPAVGTLLVATSKSHDADLKQSVVLVVHSGAEGVIGLILNHPLDGATYFGGPIPIGTRTLVRSKSRPGDGEAIVDGVFMVGRRVDAGRVFVGYVGWTVQQVKDEIARGLWTVRVGDVAVVFDGRPETLWRRLGR
jgi:putative transcriptional regulator